MEQYGVIPDVLDALPVSVIKARYASGAIVDWGNELKPSQVRDAPHSVQWPTELGSLYTLVLVDPDAPSREARHQLGEVVHWLVVNIPGTDISLGETYFEYLGAGTPENTGLHRYVLAVFEQKGVLTLDLPKKPEGRVRFSLRDFAAKHHLGHPTAGNFFLAQFEDSINAKKVGKLELALRADSLIPDVLDRAPTAVVEVKYPSGVAANLGNELTPTLVKNIPTVRWPTEPGAQYTLILTDPDAPSRAEPRLREGLHWLVVNIPGTDIEAGETYAEYIGAGPPQGSGLHRYLFLVFKQPVGRIVLDRAKVSATSVEGRYGFKTRHLVEEFGFAAPVAANYFQASYDDYVPDLHAQLQID